MDSFFFCHERGKFCRFDLPTPFFLKIFRKKNGIFEKKKRSFDKKNQCFE